MELFFIPKSVGCREANASLGCINLKMSLKNDLPVPKCFTFLRFFAQTLPFSGFLHISSWQLLKMLENGETAKFHISIRLGSSNVDK